MQKQCQVTASLWLHTNMCKFFDFMRQRCLVTDFNIQFQQKNQATWVCASGFNQGRGKVPCTIVMARCLCHLTHSACSCKGCRLRRGIAGCRDEESKREQLWHHFLLQHRQGLQTGCTPSGTLWYVILLVVPWIWDAKLTSVLLQRPRGDQKRKADEGIYGKGTWRYHKHVLLRPYRRKTYQHDCWFGYHFMWPSQKSRRIWPPFDGCASRLCWCAERWPHSQNVRHDNKAPKRQGQCALGSSQASFQGP